MKRTPLLAFGIAALAVSASLGALAGGFPATELLGWIAAAAALALAVWLFTATLSAWKQLRGLRRRGDRVRSRLKLLLLVRDLRDACAAAAITRVPHDAPAGARAACDHLSERLLGFHLGAAAWDPLAHDLSQLRTAIRAAHAMRALRPDQLRLVDRPSASCRSNARRCWSAMRRGRWLGGRMCPRWGGRPARGSPSGRSDPGGGKGGS